MYYVLLIGLTYHIVEIQYPLRKELVIIDADLSNIELSMGAMIIYN